MIREHAGILHLVTLKKKKDIGIITKTYHRQRNHTDDDNSQEELGRPDCKHLQALHIYHSFCPSIPTFLTVFQDIRTPPLKTCMKKYTETPRYDVTHI